MIWPADLACFYPYRHNVSSEEVMIALLVLGMISSLALALVRRAPYLVFGWLWYSGHVGPGHRAGAGGAQCMADRYTYLPLVGVFVMGVWGATDLLSRLRQRTVVAGVASGITLAGCMYATWFQHQYWHDSERLFHRGLRLFPEGNAMANHCLGRALFDRGDDTGARAHFEEVLRLLPGFVPGHLNLANCLSRQGHFAEARFHYQEAIRLRPENAEAYKCLGSSLAAQMHLDEARTNFLQAIRYKPDYAEAYMRLGTAEMAQGKLTEALQHLAAAVEIHPDYDEAQYFLAHALADQARFDEAVHHFRAAIKANSGNAAAMNDLARMLVTEGNVQHANLAEVISLAQCACDLTQSRQADYLETLGIALAAAGRFPEAAEAIGKGLAVAETQGEAAMAAQLQKRLELYRGGRSSSGTKGASP